MALSNFYYLVWPWIGLGGAIAIIILLFCTNILRMDLNKSRWRDGAWLAWLASAAYLVHNVEEYGIDLFGNLHQFPNTMVEMMNTNPPEVFYMAVNISMFWIASPIAARLARKHPVVATGMAGELFINALSHIAPLVGGTGYTAGTLTACIIFLPVSLWTFYTCFGKEKLSYKVLATIIGIAIVSHLILMLSIKLFAAGAIATVGIVLMQICNACLTVILWMWADHFFMKNKKQWM